MRTAAGHPVEWLVEDGMSAHWSYRSDADLSSAARTPIILGEQDNRLFSRITWLALLDELRDWLSASYSTFESLPDQLQSAFLRHVLSIGQRAGFALKDEFAYLAHMMLQLGSFSYEKEVNFEVAQVLSKPDHMKHKALRKSFGAAWKRSPLAVLGRQRLLELRDAYCALDDAPLITPDQLQQLLDSHLTASHHEELQTFLKAVDRHAKRNLQQNLHPANLLLSLLLGYRFDTDLRYHWSADSAKTSWITRANLAFEQLKKDIP